MSAPDGTPTLASFSAHPSIGTAAPSFSNHGVGTAAPSLSARAQGHHAMHTNHIPSSPAHAQGQRLLSRLPHRSGRPCVCHSRHTNHIPARRPCPLAPSVTVSTAGGNLTAEQIRKMRPHPNRALCLSNPTHNFDLAHITPRYTMLYIDTSHKGVEKNRAVSPWQLAGHNGDTPSPDGRRRGAARTLAT
jgi:hypothetical protein